jgi:hypothetical protein
MMTAGWLLAARNQNNFCCPPQYGRTSRRRYVEKKFVLFAFDLRLLADLSDPNLAPTDLLTKRKSVICDASVGRKNHD